MTGQRVSVQGRLITIEVYQKSKTVWIPVGEYRGKRFKVKASRENYACKRWAEAAAQANQPLNIERTDDPL